MVSTTRRQRTAAPSERLLITRIIAGLGLVLMLMLGFGAAGHVETDGSTPVPLGMSVLLDAQVAPLSDDAADAGGIGERDAVTEHSSGKSALMGAALCVFGVLCGLMLALLSHRLWRRRTLPDRGRRPHVPALLPQSSAIPRVDVLSLTQLGLSRT